MVLAVPPSARVLVRLSALVILQIHLLKGIFLSRHADFYSSITIFPHQSSPISHTPYQPPATGPTCHTLALLFTPTPPYPGAFLTSFSPPPHLPRLVLCFPRRPCGGGGGEARRLAEGRGGGAAASALPSCPDRVS
jgi:hypothetical protein